jgi:TonB family protein
MPTIPYLAQVSLYWLLLYACYWLLLRRHTFFAWNRAYLLASLLGAFALPLVEYPEAVPPIVYEVPAWTVSEAVGKVAPEVPAPATEAAASPAPSAPVWTWEMLLGVVYLIGVLYFGARLLRHYRRLLAFIQKQRCIDMDTYRLYLLDSDQIGSFSFLRHIVLNRTDYQQHFHTILPHELAHVRQRHSWDILLVEVLRVLFWFNPVLILYKKSLQQVHEYLADREVCAWDAPRDGYAAFMLSYALRGSAAPLVNSFFKSSLLKDRIMMLYKSRNSNWSLGRYAVVALLTGVVALLVASCEKKTADSDEPIVATNQRILIEGIVLDQDNEPLPGAEINVKGSQTGTSTTAQGQFRIIVPTGSKLDFSFVGHKSTSLQVDEEGTLEVRLAGESHSEASIARRISSEIGKVFVQEVKPQLLPNHVEDSVYTVVSQNPVFPGGVKALYRFIEETMEYPAAARRAGVQGNVFLTFVVNTDGSIQDIRVLKGMGFGTDEEAIRIMKNTPKWKPGQKADGEKVRVKYNLPITFVLPEEKGASASLGKAEKDLAAAQQPDVNAQVDSLIGLKFRKPNLKGSHIILTEGVGKSFAFRGSVSGPNAPLLVIDGVPQPLEVADQMLKAISTDDLRRIDMFEGGPAVKEKYGVRAASGVVEITTKQGEKMPLGIKK